MRERLQAVTFRVAGRGDARAVAELHAASWRAHYRHSLTEAYLGGPIEDERHAVWSERLNAPRAAQVVVLAEEAGGLVGFLCAFIDEDPEWGTLIDNLHVAEKRKGGGIGRSLMGNVAQRLAPIVPHRPVHLYVIDHNVAARAFYARIGGQPAGTDEGPMPDGSQVSMIRVLWPSPSALSAGTRRPL